MNDETRKPAVKALRPRLAASLILTRGERGKTEVLMGRRSARHVFMPNKYVFPGGRVDRADLTAPVASDLAEDVFATMTRILPERRARAAAMAAVRETAEETGLLIAREGSIRSRHNNWAPFRASGVVPDLSGLRLITRAVTPPGRSRRFDTWFFTADASALCDDRPAKPSDELEDVQWVPLTQTRTLDLPIVTHFVLDELERVLPPSPQPTRWIRDVRGKMAVEPL
ncbi:NUDIX hydrolase [Maricaulis sp.]|uniref:NUDIX hydrolase n=1 Tax=Maricaulis sp. TaxID=1486257 RepID=UPI003A92037A